MNTDQSIKQLKKERKVLRVNEYLASKVKRLRLSLRDWLGVPKIKPLKIEIEQLKSDLEKVKQHIDGKKVCHLCGELITNGRIEYMNKSFHNTECFDRYLFLTENPKAEYKHVNGKPVKYYED